MFRFRNAIFGVVSVESTHHHRTAATIAPKPVPARDKRVGAD
jgi:hypothetical protein